MPTVPAILLETPEDLEELNLGDDNILLMTKLSNNLALSLVYKNRLLAWQEWYRENIKEFKEEGKIK
jgi:hypothetical protein